MSGAKMAVRAKAWLGLIRGLWRERYGTEPQAVPAYGPDWAERGGEERLLEAAVKHCGVLTSLAGPEPRMVHAYWARAVVESWMGVWWHRRLVAAFGWPEVAGDAE